MEQTVQFLLTNEKSPKEDEQNTKHNSKKQQTNYNLSNGLFNKRKENDTCNILRS